VSLKNLTILKIKNFYEMKLRENREEIDELKAQITVLSNIVWELKLETDEERKSRLYD
tara:strand:+ start:691 stop:864 length:174 start_codon:yes stop_codon:yes gene_type:complete